MSVPKGVQFKNVKPLGVFQEYRDYYVTPVQTYGSVFSVSDIVRMEFNLNDWYLDPYESFIEAEVGLVNEAAIDFTTNVTYDATNKVQFNMMDGPSTSLISDFRLEVNSKEIERIREYDELGEILSDLNIYPDAVDEKDYEGYYSVRGHSTIHPFGSNSEVETSWSTGAVHTVNEQGFNVPIFNSRLTAEVDAFGEPIINYSAGVAVSTAILVDGTASTVNLNSLPTIKFDNADEGFTGTRIESSCIGLLSTATDAKIGGGTYGQIYNPSQFLGELTVANSNFGVNSDVPSGGTSGGTAILGNAGYLYCPYSPKMEEIDGHNIFLTNLPTTKIRNGNFQGSMYYESQNNAETRAYMQIPLLSGVMGVLIPSERWQLIPTSSLGNVNMEFRFNPNAFFSYNDIAPEWKVNKFQLKLRLYRFDPNLMSSLRSQVESGIQMHSQNFSMGPIYNIEQNVSITNNWQINNGIPSIKELFFWFLSNDFETYSYARKNYRLSQNLTSMQLKVGSTYIPENPIQGHAGEIIINSTIPQDNSVFLSELHGALNILFDCKKHTNINKVNFAPNSRPYDVSMNTCLGIPAANFTTKKKRMILDSGFTLWNEMRCRGKALYSFNLDMDKKNDDTMTGMDTTRVRPIELILKSDDPIIYNGSSTMYVMFLSDFIVSFGANDTATEGAG